MAANIISIIIRGVDQTKAGLTQSIRSLEDVKKAAANLAPALKLVGTTVALAFGALTKHSIDAADELSKLSQKTGLSTEVLSGLKHSADLSGASLEQVANGIKLLSKNMYDAAAGTGEAKDAFLAMGISVRDAQGNLKSSEEVLGEIADKFATYEDGAAKAALAQRIFGKSGMELVPLLNQGSEGLRRQREEAEKLGLVISTETGKAAEEFNDNLQRMKLSAAGVANVLIAETLPGMASATESIVAWIKETGAAEKTGKALATVFRTIAGAGILIASSFQAAGIAIGGVASILWTAIDKGFGVAADVAGEVGKELDEAIKRAQASFDSLSTTAMKSGEAIGKTIGKTGRIAPPTIAEKEKKEKPEREKPDEWAESFLLGNVMLGQAMVDREKIMDEADKEWAEAWALVPERVGQAMVDLEKAMEPAVRFDKAMEIGDWQTGIEILQSGLGEVMRSVERGQTITRQWGQMWGYATATAQDHLIAVRDVMMDTFSALEDVIVDFVMTGKAAFADFARSVIADLMKIAVRASIVQPIAGALFPSLFSAGRASGGPVTAGTSYLVGEKGPEIFRPSVSGRIIPMASGGYVQPGGVYLVGERGPERYVPAQSQSVKVEIVNESGQRMKVTNAKPSFNAQEMVVTVWLDALARNAYGLRDAVAR